MHTIRNTRLTDIIIQTHTLKIKLKGKLMMSCRKFFCIIVIIFLLFSGSGCGGGSGKSLPPASDYTTSPDKYAPDPIPKSDDIPPTPEHSPESQDTIPEPTPIISPDPIPVTITTYTVSFNSNGGSSVSSLTISSGSTVTKPRDPKKYGYTFKGWYKDSALTQSFMFGAGGDKVTTNITLHAKWIDDSLLAEIAIEKVSIGYQDGDSASHVTGNITLPRNIDVSGDIANIIWSSNNEGVISTNGTVTRINTDVTVTLTALSSIGTGDKSKVFVLTVIKASIPTPSSYTVTFNSNGGSTVASVKVSSGGIVAMPESPTRDGYVFAGWFKDSGFTEVFTFGDNGDKITEDTTLYAQWIDAETLLASYALSEIAIGYSNGDGPSYVTEDLVLPSIINTVEINGITSVNVIWSSSNPSAISDGGNVTRPSGYDTDVTLKALILTSTETLSRDFDLHVVRKTTRSKSEIPALASSDIKKMNADDSESNISYGKGQQIIDIDGSFCSFPIYNAEDAKDAVQGIHEALGINDTYGELIFSGATRTDTGVKYYFTQSFDKTEVYGRRVLVSANSSNSTNFMMSSFLSSDTLASADLSAKISQGQAEQIAKGNYTGSFDVIPDFTYQIIYSLGDYETSPVRAFAVRVLGVNSDGEYVDESVIVNALNGQIMNTMSNQCEVRKIHSADNELGRSVDFYTEYEVGPIHNFGPIIRLSDFMRDSETNVQIYEPWAVSDWVRNLDLDLPEWLEKAGDKVAECFLIQAVRDTWDSSQVSAYTNMIDIMNWWKTTFGRNSLDNRGMKVKVVTHAIGMKNNVAWMRGLEGLGGERINIYENREGSSYAHLPSAAADVLAHETTHAVMYYEISGGGLIYTAGNSMIPYLNRFPYQNATGAIDEAYADIFACIYKKGWKHAEDWYGNNKCGRNIAEPNDVDAEDSRLDIQKFFTVGYAYNEYRTVKPVGGTGGNDNNGVHKYSLIVSHAAYLMYKYGIPYDLLGELWYSTIYKGAYDATSNFHTVRKVVLNKARENPRLQGYVDTIKRAFDEVGITGDYYIFTANLMDEKNPDRDLSDYWVKISRDNEVTSLRSGTFTMLQEGTYTVTVVDYPTEFFAFSQEVDLRCDTTFNIKLSAIPRITGIIYSSDRVTPLDGAEVSIRSGSDNTSGEAIATFVSEYDGSYIFHLDTQKHGDYTVTIKKDGKTDHCNVTLNGEVYKDWYFLSDNSGDDPTPAPTPSADIPIDEEHFPDDTFRDYISYFSDTDSDGVLSSTEIANTTMMSMHNRHIASLQGIEYFTAMQSLDCGTNQLTTLDVSKNTALQYLKCDGNYLTTLDVRGLTSLRYLDCSSNRLTMLNASGCTALQHLRCGDSQLTALDVSGCTALRIMQCENNQLTTLDVSECIALQSLDCVGNQLTTLNVSGCTALQYLECWLNQLTTLDVSGCTTLQYLECYSNPLTALDVSRNTALQYLNCSYTQQLTTLDVSKNTALQDLRCYESQLTNLNVSGCTSLQRLDCHSSQLTTLNVSGCTALQSLSCTHNQLTTLNASGCTALQGLSCTYNQLTALNVSGCTALRGLSCYNNQLTTLNVSECIALQELWCHDNQLTTLNVSGCTALYLLRCDGNQLTTLDVSNCVEGIRLRYDGGVKVILPSSTTSSPTATSTSQLPEVLAVLPSFTPSASGIYTFTVSLDREIPEGSSLFLLDASKDIHGTFTQNSSPMSITVSADFTAGRTYTPVIMAKFEGESQSGGCNAGAIKTIGIILILILIKTVLTNKKSCKP